MQFLRKDVRDDYEGEQTEPQDIMLLVLDGLAIISKKEFFSSVMLYSSGHGCILLGSLPVRRYYLRKDLVRLRLFGEPSCYRNCIIYEF